MKYQGREITNSSSIFGALVISEKNEAVVDSNVAAEKTRGFMLRYSYESRTVVVALGSIFYILEWSANPQITLSIIQAITVVVIDVRILTGKTKYKAVHFDVYAPSIPRRSSVKSTVLLFIPIGEPEKGFGSFVILFIDDCIVPLRESDQLTRIAFNKEGFSRGLWRSVSGASTKPAELGTVLLHWAAAPRTCRHFSDADTFGFARMISWLGHLFTQVWHGILRQGFCAGLAAL